MNGNHREHLPDAVKAFAVHTAWRGWRATDPSIHCAYYGFESRERLDSVMAGPGIMSLIAEFDRRWGGRVTRTRDILSVSDEIGDQKYG